jgi:DNA repair photolyase
VEDEKLELVKAGCLGTCWYGKYHYVEPWVGCSFDCAYCYARSRSPVMNKLKELGTVFSKPVPLAVGDRLYLLLHEKVKEANVKIAKLSRFTDVLNPDMVANGASLQVLRTLVEAGVERIIITTKGLPDGEIIDFMAAHKDCFSYNAAAKPDTAIKFEGNIPPLADRLEAARKIKERGIQVTIHVDPIVPGIDDEESTFRAFLLKLKEHGLHRVMFSYLLLNDESINTVKERFAPEVLEQLLAVFESESRQMLPGQSETHCLEYKAELKKQNVEKNFEMLSSLGFEYVLCSLKSGKGNLKLPKENRRLCDGTFYA